MDTARFRVEAEETIASYENPNNGSGPMWCYGSPTIVRDGQRVFTSVPEVGRDVKPLCNTRWQLFCRAAGRAWERVQAGAKFDEREPCPLLRLPGGRVVLSVNPAQAQKARWGDGRISWFCEPRLLEFRAAEPTAAPAAIQPRWDKAYEFTEHSYRGAAADRHTGEVLLLHIVGHTGQAWSHRDRAGNWSRQGLLKFPVRACYPQVALRHRAACVMAVSDIVEPNAKWRAFKKRVTGRAWDYDFRNLYFTWTPDIAKADFAPVLTIDSRETTAGLIRNLDLWVGPDGDAHLLYTDRNIWHAFLRDEFFPGTPITVALKYCRVRKGEVVERRTLVEHEEKNPAKAVVPDYGALHAAADGRLFAIAHLSGTSGAGNYALQLVPKAGGAPVKLDLKHPLTTFFTASERMGTEPSDTIDLCGTRPGPSVVRYAQVKILP